MESMSKSCYCPACGFPLEFEPWANGSPSDEICPCCGIQFGYDDAAELARNARGDDRFGYRGEFLRLVSLAGSLDNRN